MAFFSKALICRLRWPSGDQEGRSALEIEMTGKRVDGLDFTMERISLEFIVCLAFQK
jgi:hypothetical protein